MAVPNFMQTLNQTEPFASLTVTTRQAILDDLAEGLGYESIINGVPNSETKAQYVNRRIFDYIKSIVEDKRRQRAISSISIVQLNA